jgi:hypothetical protein
VAGFLYENAELAVRFEIDADFEPGPATDVSQRPPSGGNGVTEVRTAYLARADSGGRQAVLSISRVDPTPAMTPEQLSEQLPIHNRRAAEMAEERGWTILRRWQATVVGGHMAMRDEYVTPGTHPDDSASGDPEDATASHVQGCVVYHGTRTYQLLLGVHPPGDIEGDRAVFDRAVGTLEFLG